MIEKLKMEQNPMSPVLETLKQVCPGAINEDGTVDFDVLKTELSDSITEGKRERYEFDWVGKENAKREYKRKIRKTLRPVVADSKNWETTKNLYIEGDNLDALKLLQKSYLRKVKMIYIDPPYNTGNDFVYCDDFAEDCKKYLDKKEVCDADGNRLFVNKRDTGHYHSNWCNMMYPRLKMARDLLTNDGVIFISIDDHEIANLKKICDEIFDVFVGIIPRTTSFQRSGQEKYMNVSHDYLLCYAQAGCSDFYNVVERDIEPSQVLEDKNGHYIHGDTKAILAASSQGYSQGGDYDFEFNGKIYQPVDSNGNRNRWLWTKERMEEAAKLGILVETQNSLRMRVYLDKVFEVGTNKLIDKDPYLKFHTADFMVERFDNPTGTSELKKLFDNIETFSNPKPVSLLKYLTKMCTNHGDIVMDFFSGSATLAHATTQLNAEDGKNRKFILVQLPENLDENLKRATGQGHNTISNAIALCDKLKKPHLLTEVAKERIHRAGEKIKAEHPDKNLDIGFRVLRVDSSNMKDVYYKPSETTQAGLLDAVDNIKNDRTDMDLLFGVMIDCGLPLDMPIETKEANGKKYYVVNGSDALVACFEEHISEDLIREIAIHKPMCAVFKDSSFAEAKDKVNVSEIFKSICGDDKALKIL